MNGKVLGRYDAETLSARFEKVGIYTALDKKGFSRFEVTIDAPGHGIPHTRLFAWKGSNRFTLIDTCITEVMLAPDLFREGGYPLDRSLDLASLYWLREEDPTASFTIDRPSLPLQEHPGLGILRIAFQVIVGMAREVRKDGIACMPKFFHDAVIFYRSRLFLFLDPAQQGRFEALARDLSTLPIGTASLLLAVDGVRDGEGRPVRWELAPQVFPLSDELRAYFNSTQYAEAVASAFTSCRFTWNDESIADARQLAQGAGA